MRFLKTNTATRITVGPFFDKTDGITPETAITVTSCKLTLMVDDGGVPTLVLDTNPTASGGANDMVHVTGDDAGFYDLELAAGNVNYVGRAIIAITDAAVHCPVFHEFMILPANVYDSLVGGTDTLQADVTQWLGTAAATPTVAGVPEVDLTHIAGATTNVAALATNVDAILTDTSTTLDDLIDTEIATIVSELAKVPKSDGTASWNATALAAINAQVDTALSDYDGPTHAELTTALDALPTAAENADAVWDEDATAHQTGGTFGQAIGDPGANTETIYDAVVTDAAGTNVAADIIAVKAETASILADTNELQTDDYPTTLATLATAAELAKVPKSDGTASWNATALAAIQSEANDALVAYDPPTKAELDSAVAPLALEATLATVDNLIDTEISTLITMLTGIVPVNGTIGATGNSTTALHLDGIAWADDGPNSMLLTIQDVSTGLYYSRWIEDFATTGDIATVATLPFTPEASVDKYWLTPVRADVTGGSGLDAAGVRAAIGLASANLDTQLTAIDDYLDTEVAAIKAKTDNLPAAPAATGDIPSAATIADAVWDEDATAHQTQGTFGQAIGDPAADTDTIYALANTIAGNIGTPSNLGGGATIAANLSDIEGQTDDIGVAGAGLTAIPWNAAWDAEVESEANDALVAQNLDHLVKSAVDTNFATTVHLDSVIGHLADAGTTATFDRTTDSAEAIQAAIDTIDNFLDTEMAAVLADTNELQTDWANGGRLDLLIDAILEDTGTTLQAEVDGIQADTEDIQTRLPAALVGGRIDATVDATGMETGAIDAILTRAMTESYNTDGSTMTVAQALYLIAQRLTEFAISGTTVTVKKLDGTTTAMTLTLDDGTSPTSSTRAT